MFLSGFIITIGLTSGILTMLSSKNHEDLMIFILSLTILIYFIFVEVLNVN